MRTNSDTEAALRQLCSCLVQYLSSAATDPHLYFDLKLSREISAADSAAELIALARKLLQWIDALDMPDQTERLDAMLLDADLPPFSMLRSLSNDGICEALGE